MLRIRIVGKGIDADAAAGHEPACHLYVLRIHQLYEVLHDNIHAVLVEITVVAEGEEVELETLALYHPFARDITDIDVSEIRLTGLRAERRELRAVKRHQIFILGVFVWESLQHLGIVVIAVFDALVAQ